MNSTFNESCPNCKSNSTFLIDHKNPSEQDLLFLCNNCGSVFLTENKILGVTAEDQKQIENSN